MPSIQKMVQLAEYGWFRILIFLFLLPNPLPLFSAKPVRTRASSDIEDPDSDRLKEKLEQAQHEYVACHFSSFRLTFMWFPQKLQTIEREI